MLEDESRFAAARSAHAPTVSNAGLIASCALAEAAMHFAAQCSDFRVAQQWQCEAVLDHLASDVTPDAMLVPLFQAPTADDSNVYNAPADDCVPATFLAVAVTEPPLVAADVFVSVSGLIDVFENRSAKPAPSPPSALEPDSKLGRNVAYAEPQSEPSPLTVAHAEGLPCDMLACETPSLETVSRPVIVTPGSIDRLTRFSASSLVTVPFRAP